PRLPDPASGDGGGVFVPIRHAASGGDAQRDFAPPGAHITDDAGVAEHSVPGMNAMSLGPYATFIVTSYLLVAAVVAMLIAWIAVDYHHQKRTLDELAAGGSPR